MSDRDRRDERRSRVRQVAEERKSGYSTTTLKLPEGLGFWQPEVGLNTIDILEYTTGKGNPKVHNEEGVPWYERTYWKYRAIGADEKDYVAAGKTFGHKDPIQEFRQAEVRKPSHDAAHIKSLEPKERQLFLIYDHKHPEKGVQLWEYSYHMFGKLLLDQIVASPEERNWDMFYYPDKRGFSLELNVQKKSMGQGNPFNQVISIYFIPRNEALPEHIVNHGYCLDDFPLETPYEELRRIFHNLPAEGTEVKKDDGGGSSVASNSTERHIEENRRHSQDGGRTSTDASHSSEKPTEAQSSEELTAQQNVVGYKAYAAGKKRTDNPWKKETPQYAMWLEGWLDGADAPTVAEKEKPQQQTAQQLGISRLADVLYNGKTHTVFRISEDGMLLTLLTPTEDIVKDVPVAHVSLPGTQQTKTADKPSSSNETQQGQTTVTAITQGSSSVAGTKKEDEDLSWDWNDGK